MSDSTSIMNLTQLVSSFDKANTATATALQKLQTTTNVNVADYMRLQVMMNQLSQVGQLVTSSTQAVNQMIKGAIQAFPTH
jgi:hypothetical protein